ncbi:MAG: alpha-hydroxy acid oxidase [Burkholderiales bacterium]
MTPVNIHDMRELARRRLPRTVFDFLDGGALDELTLQANRADFERVVFRPRVLVDVSKRSLSTHLFGIDQRMPLILGPIGSLGLLARRGEMQVARAAEQCGIPMCLSTASVCSIEEVRSTSKHPFWFQLYVGRERPVAEALIERAANASCPVLVFTVDQSVSSRRERDARNGLTFPMRITATNALDMLLHWRWAVDVLLGPPLDLGNYRKPEERSRNVLTFPQRAAKTQDPSKTWKEVDRVRSLWKGPLVIKGLLTPEEAQRAVDHGADGIVVSNHGGVILDSDPSTISALPAIVDAVKGKTKIFLDGGIRRGQDVLKAISLGADACFVGRAYAYGLAAGGQAGVQRAVRILEAEMSATMALLGINRVAELGTSTIY